MVRMFRMGHLLTALAVLGTLAFAGAARAAAPAPAAGGGGIGVIGLDAVSEGYKGYKVAMDRMNSFTSVRQDLLMSLQGGLALSHQDFLEYVDLVSAPVQVKSARATELEDLAKKNETEYQTLQGKSQKKETLTDEETKRLAELQKNVDDNTAAVNERYNKLRTEIQDEYTRYTKALTGVVDKAIDQVAKTKKLSVVMSRDIRSQEGTEKLILWGGTDITDDVIKLLNDTFKESLLDTTK